MDEKTINKHHRLNVGCGGNVREGWLNIDKNPSYGGALPGDVDDGFLTHLPEGHYTHILCKGCLNEFKTDVVTVMSQLTALLAPNGILEIKVAVVDHGKGAFRDPLAHRYLSSQWVDYFDTDGPRGRGGQDLGFTGRLSLLESSVGGETHHVKLQKLEDETP